VYVPIRGGSKGIAMMNGGSTWFGMYSDLKVILGGLGLFVTSIE